MNQPTPLDKYKVHNGYIKTITGRNLDPTADKPDFEIHDIAWAASMCVRYNGHVNRFYSIAEHALLVSKLMIRIRNGIRLYAFEGLMHDAIESYLSDVPSPFKAYLPDYVAFDSKLDAKLRAHFNVPSKTDACKEADWMALYIESYQLLPNKGEHFADPLGVRTLAISLVDEYQLECCPPPDIDESVYKRFLAEFKRLSK